MQKVGLVFGVMVAFLLGMYTLTSWSYVPTGYVGVKVYMLGGSKGVQTQQIGVGRCWVGWNEKLFKFPTFMQNYVWTASKIEGSKTDESLTFQTSDGMNVGADVGISYSIRPEKASVIFQKYRKGLSEITHIYLRNTVRDAFVMVASGLPIESVYGKGKADMMAAIQEKVNAEVGDLFDINKIYLVGKLRLPPAVTASINAKIQATQIAQQKENEVLQARADANKKVAASVGTATATLNVANAQAKANQVLAASLTPELVRYEALQKWDGKLPATMIPGSAVPFVGLK